MSRLRAYAPLSRVSNKRKALRPEHAAVYKRVAQRSGGRCEVNLLPTDPGATLEPRDSFRCKLQATDKHHTQKPRGSNTNVNTVVDICRQHHERCEWPYKRGRLCIDPIGNERFLFELRYASDKWSARRP